MKRYSLSGLTCNTTSSNGQTYIDCDIVDFVTYKTAKRQVLDGGGTSRTVSSDDDIKVPSEEKSGSAQNAELAREKAESAATASLNEEKRYLESLEAYRNLEFNTPTKEHR